MIDLVLKLFCFLLITGASTFKGLQFKGLQLGEGSWLLSDGLKRT
jgi:hypothetical protein